MATLSSIAGRSRSTYFDLYPERKQQQNKQQQQQEQLSSPPAPSRTASSSSVNRSTTVLVPGAVPPNDREQPATETPRRGSAGGDKSLWRDHRRTGSVTELLSAAKGKERQRDLSGPSVVEYDRPATKQMDLPGLSLLLDQSLDFLSSHGLPPLDLSSPGNPKPPIVPPTRTSSRSRSSSFQPVSEPSTSKLPEPTSAFDFTITPTEAPTFDFTITPTEAPTFYSQGRDNRHQRLASKGSKGSLRKKTSFTSDAFPTVIRSRPASMYSDSPATSESGRSGPQRSPVSNVFPTVQRSSSESLRNAFLASPATPTPSNFAPTLPPPPQISSPTFSPATVTPSAPRSQIKSIDEIIKQHSGGSSFKTPQRNNAPPPTPAQAIAQMARAREIEYESDNSRSSLDSINEEIRASFKMSSKYEQKLDAEDDDNEFIPFRPPPPIPDLSDFSDSHSTHSNQTTPRIGSPLMVETEAMAVERELSALLKSPRLTKIITLKRYPNQGLNVSYADVGSPTGHPVVVFLGLGCVRYLIALYDEMAEAFGLRLICLDRWGLGRTSEVSDDKRGFLEWANIVSEVVEELGLRQYSILAHSAGGPYALASSLRSPQRVRGSIHLLAPWVSTSADSLAGAYKYLKYVPTGVIRTAQAADFKMQAWRLGKLPTVVHEGIGYNHRSGTTSSGNKLSPSSPTLAVWSPGDDDESDRVSVAPSSFTTDFGPGSLYTSGKGGSVKLKPKGSKTFLGGLFGGAPGGERSSPKSSAGSDTASLRSTNGPTSTYTGRSFTPPSTLRASDINGANRRLSIISTTVPPTNSFRSPSESSQSPSSPTTANPSLTGGLRGLDLANGLLRASHSESLKGSTSDLMVLLERTSRPWGFRYSDIGNRVKVWHGDKDDRISLASVKSLESEMVDCKVTVVEGADHSMMTNGKVMIQVLESIASEW
ncbi:alpha/beta-hydrolase [Meredithblackwellia eburnea MCA 4105]